MAAGIPSSDRHDIPALPVPLKGESCLHVVRRGSFSVRIDGITSRRTPPSGFTKVVRIDRSAGGAREYALRTVRVLLKEGPLDAAAFLRRLDDAWHHAERLADLNVVNSPSRVCARAQRAVVKELPGSGLASLYARFASAEMDALQTSLLRASALESGSARAAENTQALFNLEAVVLQEMSRRLGAAENAGTTVPELAAAIERSEFSVILDTGILLDSILTHPDTPFEKIFCLSEPNNCPGNPGFTERRNQLIRLLLAESDTGMNIIRNASGTLRRRGRVTSSPLGYGGSAVVLRPKVRSRMQLRANDAFFTPRIRMNAMRRKAFYRLLDGSGLTPEFAAALREPENPEHAALEEGFDRLQRQAGISREDLFGLADVLPMHSEPDLRELRRLFLDAFGERDARHVRTGPLEALFRNLAEFRGNALALLAIAAREGRPDRAVIAGINYVVGEVTGGLVPRRDIAEIRISLGDFPDAASREAARLRACRIAGELGIPVRFLESPLTIGRIMSGTTRLDAVALPPAFRKAVADPAAFADAWFADRPALRSGRAPERPRLNAFALARLSEAIARFSLKTDGGPGELGLERFMQEEGEAFLQRRLEVLDLLERAPCETEEVRNAFAGCVLSAGELPAADAPRLIFTTAQEIAAHLRRLLELPADAPAASPRHLFSFILEAFDRTEASFRARPGMADLRLVSPAGRTLITRICFNAVNALAFGRPALGTEELLELFERLNATVYTTSIAAFNRILTACRETVPEEDINRLKALLISQERFMQALGRMLEGRLSGSDHRFTTPRPLEFTLPFTFIPAETRELLRMIAPEAARWLDAAHPAYRPFPAARRPEGLPRTGFGCRSLLLRALDICRANEGGRDRMTTAHGRGHLVRTFIFAQALTEILREKGIRLDAAAIACGVAGHNVRRETGILNRWRAESADCAVDLMRETYGDVMGEEWESAFACLIRQDGDTGTLEEKILRAADRLDAGRLDGAGSILPHVFPKQSPYLELMREELYREADLLQRITDPFCATRNAHRARRDAVIDLTENPVTAMQRLSELEDRLARASAELQGTSSEALLQNFLSIVREMPEMFPILSKYGVPQIDAPQGVSRTQHPEASDPS